MAHVGAWAAFPFYKEKCTYTSVSAEQAYLVTRKSDFCSEQGAKDTV